MPPEVCTLVQHPFKRADSIFAKSVSHVRITAVGLFWVTFRDETEKNDNWCWRFSDFFKFYERARIANFQFLTLKSVHPSRRRVHSSTECDTSDVTCALSESKKKKKTSKSETEWWKCWGVKQVLQQNQQKRFEITPSLFGWFWSFADEFSISASLWRGYPLVVYVWCGPCRPVGSQPAAEWMRSDSPCIWPIVPYPGLGLESFLLAALGAAAPVKDISPGLLSTICSGRPSPRLYSYVAWAAALCERTMYRVTTWGLKS